MNHPSAERLSAYVDGALGHRDRERAASHLLACDACRDRARDLRSVRDRVRRASLPASAPSDDLAARLVGIAGDDASAPLHARPFDAHRRGAGRTAMPSRRRSLRRAVVTTGSGASALALILVAIGWVAAPPTRTPAVDPTALALSEFAAALGAEPLANPAVTAAMATDPAETTEQAVAPAAPEATTSDLAYARLERAEQAADTVAYAGTQLVQVRHLAGFWTSRVDVLARPGRGVEVTVNPGRSASSTRAFLPDEDSLGVDLLGANHSLTTGDGPQVAGRPTHVVEAYAGGSLAARWWLDRETGVLLWSQSFEGGRTVQSAGFETIRVGSAAVGGGHVAPRLTMPVPVTALTIGAAPQLVARGFSCPSRMGGLDLIGVRDADGVLHSSYGDGIETLSVFESRGALAKAPAGSVWDPALKAYRSQDLPTMITWQSRDRVFTVVTDGPAERAAAAVRALPHDPPVLRTRTDRVVDGWRHLLEVG
ncbi:anti-sigma factor family protein [Mariniluteicoccus flavus]